MPELSPKQTNAIIGLDRLSRTIGDGEGLGWHGGKRRETGGGRGGGAKPAGPYAELQVTSNF